MKKYEKLTNIWVKYLLPFDKGINVWDLNIYRYWSQIMLEYIITHIFDAFGLFFFNRKGNNRGKTHFFSYKMHFCKLRKNCPIFTSDMSIERTWHVENIIFVNLQKY